LDDDVGAAIPAVNSAIFQVSGILYIAALTPQPPPPQALPTPSSCVDPQLSPDGKCARHHVVPARSRKKKNFFPADSNAFVDQLKRQSRI
jgi:hypothetical protein